LFAHLQGYQLYLYQKRRPGSHDLRRLVWQDPYQVMVIDNVIEFSVRDLSSAPLRPQIKICITENEMIIYSIKRSNKYYTIAISVFGQFNYLILINYDIYICVYIFVILI
jgi:hypothetical protein